MTKRTIDMIIRIGIEVVEWVSIILKEKRRLEPDPEPEQKPRPSGRDERRSRLQGLRNRSARA